MKKRVKFKVKGSDNIQIGYLIKDKTYTNWFKVTTPDMQSSYCLSLIKMIEKI